MSWLFSQRSATPGRSTRLAVESLEDRLAPSTTPLGDGMAVDAVREPLAEVVLIDSTGDTGVGDPTGLRGVEVDIKLEGEADPPDPDAFDKDARATQDIFRDATVGDPFVGDPFVGDPFVGDPFVGDPFVGDPFVGDPFVGDPFVGDPFVGDPTGR